MTEMGHVESFDVEVGLGVVAAADGRSYPFHCTAISNGSRRIEAGRRVVFVVGAGGPGRWEALVVTPVEAGPTG
jgi:cold shock CspA family protein